jgi:hypothetical protein
MPYSRRKLFKEIFGTKYLCILIGVWYSLYQTLKTTVISCSASCIYFIPETWTVKYCDNRDAVRSDPQSMNVQT